MSIIHAKEITWLEQKQPTSNEMPSTLNELFSNWQPSDPGMLKEIPSAKRISSKNKTSWPAARFSNISISEYYFDEIADEIKRADSYLSGKAGVERIEKIWGRIDQLSALAESKLRIRIQAIDKPKLSKEIPDELCRQLEIIKKAPEAAIPALEVVSLVTRLLRALPAGLIRMLDIDIRWLGIGTIEVNFKGNLTWLVYPVRVPWPAVKVKTIFQGASDNLPVVNTFFTAQSVIEYSLKSLGYVER
jgi:hypothetical protein